MASARFASVLLLLLATRLVACAHANTYFECDCSPTNRGYLVNALVELRKYVGEVDEIVADMRAKKLPQVEIEGTQKEEAIKRWISCQDNFSPEVCVNADAEMRLGNCYPNCPSFCKFHEPSWVNVNDGKKLPACDKSIALNAINADIIAGRAERHTQFRSPAVRPSPMPAAKTSSSDVSALPIPADPPAGSSAAGSGSDPNEPVSGADVAVSTIPITATSAPIIVESPAPVNEGCVAVEHLQGFVLQHRTHLRRAVLCHDGFCATPNHAVIIKGRWTSMKRMCVSEWTCVSSMKLVNNLKVSANTRAVISDSITVTPYDIRFPIAAVWMVQMVQDVANIVFVAVVVASVTAAGVAASAKLNM